MHPRRALALFAAPLLAAIFASALFPPLHLAFGALCHQAPERCFHLAGAPLGVCARCLGFYAGALAAAARPAIPSPKLLWGLAAANGLEYATGFGGLATRFTLAFALCWIGLSRLLSLASPQDAGSN